MSPRTPHQYQVIRDEKRSLIMDSALEHFAREGYHNTTISHIARHAGISKGLMYNYFESKEELLREIIHKSIKEAYSHFDLDSDGVLSEEEFDFFVRKVADILREKKYFWRLFIQLLIQKEVREVYTKLYIEGSGNPPAHVKPGFMISDIMRILTEYFLRKKEKKGTDYDPYLDLNLFIISLKGFAITHIYEESDNDVYYEKTIDKIIEQFK